MLRWRTFPSPSASASGRLLTYLAGCRRYDWLAALVVELVDSLDLFRGQFQQISLDDLNCDREGKIHGDDLPTRSFFCGLILIRQIAFIGKKIVNEVEEFIVLNNDHTSIFVVKPNTDIRKSLFHD